MRRGMSKKAKNPKAVWTMLCVDSACRASAMFHARGSSTRQETLVPAGGIEPTA
jgi:hypothetical protein